MNGAAQDILDVIEGMPDIVFENMAEVMKAYPEADRDKRDSDGSRDENGYGR